MKRLIISIITILLLSNLFAQTSKTITLNKKLGNVGDRTDFYINDITVTIEQYIIKFHFTTDSYYSKIRDCKIDNVFVGNYQSVTTNGMILGKMYNDPNIRKLNVAVSRKFKKLYLKGVGTDSRDFTIDLTEFDSFLPQNETETHKTQIKPKDIENPVIILNCPELINDLFRTEEFTSIIKGKATDNEGIFQVYINDETASLKSNGQFQKRIKLKIGKNPIEIKVVDINDNESTKKFLIIRDEIIEEDEFSDVDFAFETLNNKPNAIAVVFGIEEYQYAPNVSNAYSDAEIIREYLISTFGLKRENIYFRYNEIATKGEFEKVFSENGWISKNANKNSEIYVFYAGHGIASTKDKSAYLIPYDIDPNYASTGYSLNDLYQNLSKIKSKSTTIILDACFSGISRENEMLLADSRPVSIEVKQGSIPKNLTVFTASSGNEISSGYSQKMHGLFTYFFLKGLNKNADVNNDTKITLGEMEQYLKENVSSQAQKMGREQNPQLHTSDKDKVLLKY